MKDEFWLELNKVNIIKNDRTILKDISIRLEKHKTIALLGPNGSGKSTLIETIARCNYPIVKDGSFIKILGKEKINIFDMRSKIGFVYSELDKRIKDNQKTIDVISAGILGYSDMRSIDYINIKTQNKAIQIMRTLDISDIEDMFYCDLSDGQKRKVLIGRALINDPTYLVIDEITNALDIKSKYEIINILNTFSRKSKTLFYVTHSLDSILKFTDRVILIKDGVITNDGLPQEILTSKNLSKLYDIELNITYTNGYWISTPIT